MKSASKFYLKKLAISLDDLHTIKRLSDEKKYKEKGVRLAGITAASPADWVIDSHEKDGIVGITHIPTSYRFHVPRRYVHRAVEDITIKKNAGNIANHGYLTGLDGVLATLDIPFTFRRPRVSDYAYKMMRERTRAANLATPSIIASNPMLSMFGSIGKNKLFQYLFDRFATPGGSRVDAFKSILGGGPSTGMVPGAANVSANVERAKGILGSVNQALSDSDGIWDYNKSHGFNRTEAINNLKAFSSRFGNKIP